MKRMFFLVLALCTVLSGCSRLVPSEYVRVSKHDAGGTVQENADVLSANDFQSLKAAILSFVKSGIEHGVIRVQSYESGDVEEDLTAAAYQVSREDPYGAYMVDYMTHSCSLIVSYYEIGIDITFRPGAVAPEKMKSVTASTDAKRRIQQAMDRYDDRLVMYISYNLQLDLEQTARDYFEQNPGRLMAMPEIRCTAYPENRTPRIVEMTFDYPYDKKTLQEMETAVQDSLHAASVYVRYRDTELEKAELLFTYLMERFAYKEKSTQTPVYSHLCDGLTTSKSAAQSWQLLCEEAGLECVTVSGLYQGAEHWWNIVCLDGEYSHVDTFRDLLGDGTLHLYDDSEMTDYYWDTTQYPACVHPEPEDLEETEEPEETGEEVPEPGEGNPEAGDPEARDPEEGNPEETDPEKPPQEPLPGEETEPDAGKVGTA